MLLQQTLTNVLKTTRGCKASGECLDTGQNKPLFRVINLECTQECVLWKPGPDSHVCQPNCHFGCCLVHRLPACMFCMPPEKHDLVLCIAGDASTHHEESQHEL